MTLIATLVNLDNDRAQCTVERWRSTVPPYTLLRDNRQYIIDPLQPQDYGDICTATYNEVHPNRAFNITGLPLKKLKLTQAEQEEQAA